MDSGGWDEIFPSVSPENFAGVSIPDHGDLVGLAWDVDELAATHVTMSARTRFADCHFQRVVRLVGDTIHLSYRVENHSSSPVPYLWCAHPLLAIEPGMQIILPTGTPMFNRGGSGVDRNDFLWPQMADGKRMDQIPHPSSPDFQPYAIKMFTAAHAIHEVTISSADGRESLSLQWNPQQVPHLGLWLNVMAWSGSGSAPYFNLGIEPTTAAHDSLSDAHATASARELLPGQTHTWEMTARITAMAKATSPHGTPPGSTTACS
jgi:galactose mutarotase-like enzyme